MLRFFTILATLGLIGTAFAAEIERVPSKITIKKKVEWDHGQWSEAIEQSKLEILSRKRRAFINAIQKTLAGPSMKKPKIPDNYVELCARLTRYALEEHYVSLAKNNKKESDLFLRKADHTISLVVSKYPSHRRMDEFLYLKALVYMDQQKLDLGVRAFVKLISQFPNSRYVHDARTQLGDHLFDRGQITEAEGHYDAVITANYEPLLSYAKFRKAWCAYNTGRLEESVSHFRWIIDNEKNGPKTLKMKDEAFKDVVYPLADLGKADTVAQFFAPFDKAVYRKGVETAAMIWFERGNYPPSNELWSNLLSIDPVYHKNPYYDIYRIEGLYLKGEKEVAIRTLLTQIPIYFEESEWKKANAGKPEVASHLEKWEEVIRKESTFFHAVGERDKNKAHLQIAKEGYQNYLKYFGENKESFKIMTQLGSLLYTTQEYPESASVFYQSIAKATDPEALKKNFESAIDIKMMCLHHDKEKSGTPMTDVEKEFIGWVDEFAKKFPDQEKSNGYIFKKATLYHAHQDSDKAISIARDLSQKKGEYAERAGFLAIDILGQRKEWENMVEYCDKLLATHANPKFQKEVSQIQRKAELKHIETLEADKKYEDAANGYLKYSKKYGPTDPKLHEVALYNAAVNFAKAEKYVLAANTRETFLKTFPKSPTRPEVMQSLAGQYENFAEYEKGAKLLYDLSVDYPQNSSSKRSLEDSATLYSAAGQYRNAERSLLLYIERNPRETYATQKKLVQLYREAGFRKKERQVLEEILHKGTQAEQFIHKYELADLKSGRKEKIGPKTTDELYEMGRKYPTSIRKNRQATELFAKVSFNVLKKEETEFHRLRLTGKGDRLAEKVKTKLQMLKQLEKNLLKVAAIGNPEWALASIYRAAALYHQLGQEIQQTPVPAELSGEETEKYRKGVNDMFVAPLFKKALTLVERCMENSATHKIVSEWTAQCYAIGTGLDGNKYARARTFYMPYVEAARIDDDGDEEATGHRFGFERKLASNEDMSGDGHRAIPVAFHNLPPVQVEANAIADLREKLKESPNSLELKNELAILHMRLGQYDMAERILQVLVNRYPKVAALQNNLGVLHFLQGEEQKGVVLFEKAPNNSAALRNLANLSLRSHNGPLAKKYFEQIPQKGPFDRTGQMVADVQTFGLEDGLLVAARDSGDPYALIQAIYYLIDVEKDMPRALEFVQGYLKSRKPAQEDGLFQRALQEIQNSERVASLSAPAAPPADADTK